MKIKDVNENKSKTSDFGHGASFMGRGGEEAEIDKFGNCPNKFNQINRTPNQFAALSWL